MNHRAQSIRAFIGAADFQQSRQFYQTLGFEESVIAPNLVYFRMGDNLGFYLQDYYVKEWIENTMLFVEVDDADQHWHHLKNLELDKKWEKVKLMPVKEYDWGKECFLLDPSGILWHFGSFK